MNEPDDLMPFDPTDEDSFQQWWQMLDQDEEFLSQQEEQDARQHSR